jgi:hypothetical protein
MSFDPQSFLDMSVEGENSTVSIPVPVGEYVAVAEKVDVRQWTGKHDPTKSGLTLEVFWNIDDANVKELLGRDKITVKQGIMLDLTESGGLDMGKGRNVSLGKLRAALDLNNPGQAFSFNQIPGRVAKIAVKHRIADENIYPEVGAVAKM